MHPHISIRGFVRPSFGPLVHNALGKKSEIDKSSWKKVEKSVFKVFIKMLENEKTRANLHAVRLKDASIGQILALFLPYPYAAFSVLFHILHLAGVEKSTQIPSVPLGFARWRMGSNNRHPMMTRSSSTPPLEDDPMANPLGDWGLLHLVYPFSH